MKKVLIITYYWPPAGGGGVQRWLKFSKYLPEFGWKPIVFTPENPEFPVTDESLFNDIHKDAEVLKIPIREPYQWYRKLTGKKKDSAIQTGFLSEVKKKSWKEKLSIWLRGNLFIPDARVFWVRPSVRFLRHYLLLNPVDLIISTGPPHSMHLIAMQLNKILNIPWIADFRDPWTNIDYYGDLMITKWADNIHKKLEARVLKNADSVLTVSYNWADDFRQLGAQNVDVVTNGYDISDFAGLQENIEPDRNFSISHIGYMNKDRNPLKFWQAVKELCNDSPGFKDDIRLKFIGKTDYSVFNSLEENGLSFAVEKIDYLPHDKVLIEYKKSRVLLLLLNQTPDASGRVPGKIFEYMISGTPVLSIGPEDGDSAKIINETGTGYTVGFQNKEKMKMHLLKLYSAYKTGTNLFNIRGIEKYERKNLTADLVSIMENLKKKL